MRDELSVSGAHTRQSYRLTPLPFFPLFSCSHRRPDTIPPPAPTQTRRGCRHERWARKILGERSKGGMSRSPQKQASTQSTQRSAVLTGLSFDYLTLTSRTKADIITIAQVLPLLLFAFDCKCQRRLLFVIYSCIKVHWFCLMFSSLRIQFSHFVSFGIIQRLLQGS